MVNGVQAASGGQGRGAAPSIHSIAPAAVTLCTFRLDELGLGPILPHHWDPQSGSAQLGPGHRTLSRGTLTLPSLRQPSPQLQATFPGALVTERGRLVRGPDAVAKTRPQQRLSGVSPGGNLKAAPGSLAPQSPSAWKPGFLLPGFQGVEFDLGRGQVVCFPLDLVAMPSLN